MFVTLLTARVMNKCNSPGRIAAGDRGRPHEEPHQQTMEGLTVPEGFCTDIKGVKKVSKAVMKDLLKKFCSKGVLETVISLEDPVVDKAIVQCLQAHTRSYSAKLAKNATPAAGGRMHSTCLPSPQACSSSSP
ncbi:hypothetical protein GBF38_009192 [Nibea albiflora]|uniref:Uncharacterized protein n=1 Tax=Nibea albiflora TaxID=240163 RepID=A0ACB7EPY0_NIBAL|nr:hypothetical protein GBF38_009192 [Nibea albiflora]